MFFDGDFAIKPQASFQTKDYVLQQILANSHRMAIKYLAIKYFNKIKSLDFDLSSR